MTYEERRPIYEAAIACYGMDSQIWMAVEEMSELTKELAKIRRGSTTISNLVDEIADVTILMEQLRIMFGVNELVNHRMEYKTRRLEQQIAEDVTGLRRR